MNKSYVPLVRELEQVGFEHVGGTNHDKFKHPATGAIMSFSRGSSPRGRTLANATMRVRHLVAQHEHYRVRPKTITVEVDTMPVEVEVPAFMTEQPEKDITQGAQRLLDKIMADARARGGVIGTRKEEFERAYKAMSIPEFRERYGPDVWYRNEVRKHFGLAAKSPGPRSPNGKVRVVVPAHSREPEPKPEPPRKPAADEVLEAAATLEGLATRLEEAFRKLANALIVLERQEVDEQKIIEQVEKRIITRLTGGK